MKDIITKINESSSNLCTFDASKFDNEKLGLVLMRLGESLHAFPNKAKEFTIEQYVDEGKSIIDIRIKDKSYNEYYKNTITSK